MDDPSWTHTPEAVHEVDLALDTLEQAQQRPYLDVEADAQAATAYYGDVPPHGWGDLVARTHERRPRYRPSVEVYPWVDLQPDLTLRSLYTGQVFDPAELIRADAEVLDRRHRRAASLEGLTDQTHDQLVEQLEAALPYNCEHVVPQSWFGRAEPMRGDLHHLFACESRCNSFRGNTPFVELPDWPPEPEPEPDLPDGVLADAVRPDCGKRTDAGFEPAQGKGAAARALLFVALRYPGVIEPDELDPARYDDLLLWHAQDPAGDWERHRNAAIHERQGNRNPFVDHPDRAEELVALLRQ
ncbi:endonuclease I family protein [Aquipuribacter sp. MA13-6]|uniref:endonuclease I family protein n=1 Tax=unclassified Aquipuribacter TaxID=2635084 RepID=UPI003EEC718B